MHTTQRIWTCALNAPTPYTLTVTHNSPKRTPYLCVQVFFRLNSGKNTVSNIAYMSIAATFAKVAES